MTTQPETSAISQELASASAPVDERVPLSTILTYAAPLPGVGFMFFLISMYLMIYATDVLGMAPAAMGLIFGLSRIWDGISDPLAGYLSDRTQTRMGRRRPWMLGSIVPIVLAFVMIWSPPASLSGGALVGWMAVAVIGFYTAMTIVSVPHASLGAELSKDYDDRNRVFAWRHIGFTVGSFVAVGGMWLLIQSKTPSSTAFRLAIAGSIVTAATMLFAVIRIRERPEYQGRGSEKPFAAFADVLKNPHARLLLFVALIENLGAANISIMTPYVAKYRLGVPEFTHYFVLAYMVASLSTALIWVRLAKRFDKKRMWLCAMPVSGLAFGAMFFAGEGQWQPVVILCLFAGAAGGCGGVVVPSIQSDIIDFDEHRSGQRKEGAYFAAWSFIYKGSAGLTLMLTGFVLQFSGYQPGGEQTDQTKFAMGALFSFFPLVSYLCGALLFTRFRLNRAEHAKIKRELEARRRAAGG